jgi:iduronate 2-sulfatase
MNLFLAALFAVFTPSPLAPARPNVIMIVCDDLNTTSIGHLKDLVGGHPQSRTPNIDALASCGVSFRRAYSNNPICAPSRASFLTGIYPHTSGNLYFQNWTENPVLAQSRTLMEHFRCNGYIVVGSGKMMHSERLADWDEFPHGVNYGPMAYDGKKRVGHPAVPEPFRSIGPIDGSFAPLSDVPFGEKEGGGWIDGTWGKIKRMDYTADDKRDATPDEKVADWAAQRLKTFAREAAESSHPKPFFMGVGFVRPHTPMHAPKKYFDMFPLASMQLPVIRKNDAADTHYRSVFTEQKKGIDYFKKIGLSYAIPEDGLKSYVRAYLACVAAVDDNIGTVLEALDQSPLKNNTIVILTSDHGFNLGEKDYLFKDSPWEESMRVPLIVRAPGVSPAGGIAEHPVGLVDIYPTLVDLCGLTGDTRKNPQGKPLDGFSMRPFLENPASREWQGPDFALSMIYAGQGEKSHHWCIRSERWRYIRYSNGNEELYDHQSDPHEWTNLAAYPEHEASRKAMFSRLPEFVRASAR